MGHGPGTEYVHYNEDSLYLVSFPYTLLLRRRRISFAMPKTSLYTAVSTKVVPQKLKSVRDNGIIGRNWIGIIGRKSSALID